MLKNITKEKKFVSANLEPGSILQLTKEEYLHVQHLLEQITLCVHRNESNFFWVHSVLREHERPDYEEKRQTKYFRFLRIFQLLLIARYSPREKK